MQNMRDIKCLVIHGSDIHPYTASYMQLSAAEKVLESPLKGNSTKVHRNERQDENTERFQTSFFWLYSDSERS